MKIIAITFSVLYFILGLLDFIGDRDEKGLIKLLGSLVVLCVIYYILRNKEFGFKNLVFIIIAMIIPFVIFGTYLIGFLDALF